MVYMLVDGIVVVVGGIGFVTWWMTTGGFGCGLGRGCCCWGRGGRGGVGCCRTTIWMLPADV